MKSLLSLTLSLGLCFSVVAPVVCAESRDSENKKEGDAIEEFVKTAIVAYVVWVVLSVIAEKRGLNGVF